MTEQQIIDIIEGAIVANGNNEITADVLRPVLVSMVSQINDLLGDLNSLNTIDKNSLVGALNEVFNKPSSGGINILNGTADPNSTPPSSFQLGDFYNRTTGGNTADFYVYNGNEWVLLFNKDESLSVGNGFIQESSLPITNVSQGASVIIFKGNSPGYTINLPTPVIGSSRELTIINQSAYIVFTSDHFITFDDDRYRSVHVHESIKLKSQGAKWYQIA